MTGGSKAFFQNATEAGGSGDYAPLKAYCESATVCRGSKCIDINPGVIREVQDVSGISEDLLSRLDLALDEPYANDRDDSRPDAQDVLPGGSG